MNNPDDGDSNQECTTDIERQKSAAEVRIAALIASIPNMEDESDEEDEPRSDGWKRIIK